MALLLNYLIPGGLFSGNAQFGATDANEISLGGGVGAETEAAMLATRQGSVKPLLLLRAGILFFQQDLSAGAKS